MGDVLSLHTVVKSNDDQVDGRPSKKCKELKVLDPKAGQNLCEYGLAHTHTRLTALFRDYPGEPVPER